MKKILFAIMLTASTLFGFAQQTLRDLTPTSFTTLSLDDNLYTDFISNGMEILKSEVVTLDTVMEGHTSNTGIRNFICKINNSLNYNYLIGVYNVTTKEKFFLLEKFTLNDNFVESKIYDTSKNLLYSTYSTSQQMDYIPNAILQRVSCFGSCMDAQEANFESTFSGWLFWNMPPHSSFVQAMAAINCQGCCKRWWSNAGCGGGGSTP